ncbi:hypothetical protein N431DRAFT_442638 [Stipitochalara longipes BDJ]|nr:hypothetical protein N431DRAFT_442638 [Stipitochalara longipes BDJ]
MLAKNVLTVLSVAFATLSSASPLEKRAVTVFTDTGSASITPAIATQQVVSPDAADGDVGGKADAAGAVAEVIRKVVNLIQGLIDGDTVRRQRFTQETVSAVSVQFPGRSVVMSNVGYSLTCTPEVIQHTSYNAKIGYNVSYDVLIFGNGCTFTLKGDGGFQNWAYILKYGCTANGGVLTC